MKSILLVMSLAVSFNVFSSSLTYKGVPSDSSFSECSLTIVDDIATGSEYRVGFTPSNGLSSHKVKETFLTKKSKVQSETSLRITRVKKKSGELTNHFTLHEENQKTKGTIVLAFEQYNDDLRSIDFSMVKKTTSPITMVQGQCVGFLCEVKVEWLLTKAVLRLPETSREEIEVSCLDLKRVK